MPRTGPSLEKLPFRPDFSSQSRTRASALISCGPLAASDRPAQQPHVARHAARDAWLRPFGILGIRRPIDDLTVRVLYPACRRTPRHSTQRKFRVLKHVGIQTVIRILEHQEDPVLILLIRLDVEVEEAKQQVLRHLRLFILGVGFLGIGFRGVGSPRRLFPPASPPGTRREAPSPRRQARQDSAAGLVLRRQWMPSRGRRRARHIHGRADLLELATDPAIDASAGSVRVRQWESAAGRPPRYPRSHRRAGQRRGKRGSSKTGIRDLFRHLAAHLGGSSFAFGGEKIMNFDHLGSPVARGSPRPVGQKSPRTSACPCRGRSTWLLRTWRDTRPIASCRERVP